jgi:F-type H+/Na+-transporting ATPase subunit beta
VSEAGRNVGGFWAYENWRAHGHRATVHRGECSMCNQGAGVHGGGETPNGKWHGPFSSYGGARSAAARSGADVHDCRMCWPDRSD